MPYFGATTLATVLKDLQGRQALPESGKGLISTINDRRNTTLRLIPRKAQPSPALAQAPGEVADPHDEAAGPLPLPKVGSTLRKGEAFGVIESVKAVSDLFSPVSGEVIEVNQTLEDNPELVNADCYGDGWIVAVDESDDTDMDDLMDAAAYRAHVEEREE